MPQTLLAFLATMILSSFALNQQRALMLAHQETYSREAEMVAIDLALKHFAAMERQHFDEALAGPVADPMGMPLGQLTVPADLGPDGGARDDLDDFHHTVLRDKTHTLNGETHRFRWRTQVRYADPAGLADPNPVGRFGAKRVVVEVYEPDADPGDPEREKRYFRLERVYTLAGMVMQ